MEEPQHAAQQSHQELAQQIVPWLVGTAALVLYIATLNHWVTAISLPWTAQAAGWDWSLPGQAPLFFILTFPFRALPAAWQPIALNSFAALCASLTLVLLARSVSILPHDRTHDQRQRERSEFSLLSIRAAWLPPVLAAAACGLEWTFWENATAMTNEMLSLLLFAGAVRALLEYRLDRRPAWMYQASFLYALGMTNNAGTIGLFPLFMIAMVWIMGREFFRFQFLVRAFLFGLAGVSLYLLIPVIWSLQDNTFSMWQVLRAELGIQKAFLFNIPGLRNRAFLIGLTTVLPVILMGVRWPSSFGDTSAAGTKTTQLMFRVLHLLLLAAALWNTLDFQYSPRGLGMGYTFLAFYYLGALAIGYYSGYLLLVSSQRSGRHRHRRSSNAGLGFLMKGVAYLALIGLPAALIYRNLPRINGSNGSVLHRLITETAESLPSQESVVLSDDPYALLLLQGELAGKGLPNKHLLLYTRALPSGFYQRRLEARYPGRWKSLVQPGGHDTIRPDVLRNYLVATAAKEMPRTPIYYLQPSFGYYFERFYAQQQGLLFQMRLYTTNEFFPPALTDQQIAANHRFWQEAQDQLDRVRKLNRLGIPDAAYAAQFYSRALNAWGVEVQAHVSPAQAGAFFEQAASINTNNIPAQVNLEWNRNLLAKTTTPPDLSSANVEDRFGSVYRQWDQILSDNGPFDAPDFCMALGNHFAEQSLPREAAIQYHRASRLAPQSPLPLLALANVYLRSGLPDKALEVVHTLTKNAPQHPMGETNQVQLVQLEAGAYFAKKDLDRTENLLLKAQQQFGTNQVILDSLVEFYQGQGRWTNALAAVDRQLQAQPSNADLILKKAAIYGSRGDYEQALQAIDNVLARAPQDLRALLYKGAADLQLRRFDDAIKAFSSVLSVEPDNTDAQLSCAAAYLQTKAYAKAIPLLDAILKKDPDNWAALRNRAIANLSSGSLDASRRDYESLVKLFPSDYAAYFGLGEIAYKEKKNKVAAENYELYLKYYPNSATNQEMVTERAQVEERLKTLKPSKS